MCTLDMLHSIARGTLYAYDQNAKQRRAENDCQVMTRTQTKETMQRNGTVSETRERLPPKRHVGCKSLVYLGDLAALRLHPSNEKSVKVSIV